jgi:hypothetical protein
MAYHITHAPAKIIYTTVNQYGASIMYFINFDGHQAKAPNGPDLWTLCDKILQMVIDARHFHLCLFVVSKDECCGIPEYGQYSTRTFPIFVVRQFFLEPIAGINVTNHRSKKKDGVKS